MTIKHRLRNMVERLGGSRTTGQRPVTPPNAEDGESAARPGTGTSVVRLDFPAHEIRLIAASDMEREWRAHSCAKEPWTVAWIEESLQKGGVLYDIGANVGAFSLVAAKVGGKRVTVVSFEPGYASFAHLCDNIVLNDCQKSIIPVPLALGSATGIGTLKYKTLDPGQSRHRFYEGAWRRAASASRHYHQPVLSMTLDDVVAQFGLPLPDHIKLDVDGAELNVLQGASATLAAPSLKSILIEIDETLTEPALALLHGAGFALDRKHDHEHHTKTRVWYGVFRRMA